MKLSKNENFVQIKQGWCYFVVENEKTLIYGLFIRVEYRNQGWADKILKLIIELIEMGHYKGVISIETSDLHLKEFYERYGLNVIYKEVK